jgi:hypothetical protein
MQTHEFWNLVEAVLAYEDLDDRVRGIAAQLEGMTEEELAGFRDQLDQQIRAGWRRELYAAGVLLTGRTFDDEERFQHFLCGLILRGRALYKAVLAEPDALATYDFTQQEKELDYDAGMLFYAPQWAYQERRGEEADLDTDFPPPAAELPEIDFAFDMEELRRMFPRLWLKRRAMVEPRESMP